MQELLRKLLIYVLFYEFCAFFCELCDRMRFEVDCAKLYHCVISEGLYKALNGTAPSYISELLKYHTSEPKIKIVLSTPPENSES